MHALVYLVADITINLLGMQEKTLEDKLWSGLNDWLIQVPSLGFGMNII